ncbi:proton-conducting transporter transmembrane domain-containing protein [Paracraurococcus lichenis]|uniref:Proton-conducting transporter membrane subunit n=1 Tax=Paracraurococcus lichenis TaxID=3064888 RepID=A0ABT9DZ71_9PROT|nr:proton-conducting transporter membrane subunit [Paracraurococcus sp. LOR1-02]MDO9709208.1 proton-conducting transporter membrane subunit [Paracraurococcus sp. LOR1-02]
MLTALAFCLGLLVLVAAAAVVLGRHPRAGLVVHGGCLIAAVGFLGVSVAALLGGTAPEGLTLPLGPPWAATRLALDGLSAWFLLLLGITAACASLFALGHRAGPPRTLPPFPLFLAGMGLTLAATDAFTLLLGFEAMSLASWALVAAEHDKAENRAAARLYLTFAVLAGACLVPAFGLLAGGAGAITFEAMRAAPPEGWRAVAVLALGLAGAGAKAGLVPLHAWLPLAHPAAPSHVSALMSGAMTKVALYMLARLLLDLCGPAQPSWWGVPLLVLGAGSALLGALRANLEGDIKTLLACSTIENIGFVVLGLGLALAFRGADLGPLAALAAGAALLHALNHGVFKTLLFLVAGAVQHSAGSRRLDRLGGLIHAMPATAGAALVGACAAASLPPLSGFAGEWLLLQSLLAGWRVSAIAFQVLAAAAAALAAMAAALAAAAMLRMFGLVFLGRPRSPRGAGAEEVNATERAALLLPAGLTVLFGLFPGLLLGLAAPAVRILAGRAAEMPVRGLWLTAGEGAAGYAPFAVLLLLAAALVALWFAVRRRSPLPTARGPVWNCGFIDPPPHFPFGDPLTQPTAGGIAQPLRRMLGEPLLAARERVDMPRPGETRAGAYASGFEDPSGPLLIAPAAALRERISAQVERLRDFTIRRCLSLSFATLVGLLALLAWLEGR